MNILGVQIIAILFAVFMIYVSFLNWKRKDLSNSEFLFWSVLWFSFISITLFPNILAKITSLLFFARVMDLLMLVSFMILAILGFQNYIANKKMNKRIEDFIRKETLKDLKKKK